jgi:predicted outer membrane repeat protein
MPPHTRIPGRTAAVPGAATIHRGRSARARAAVAVGVLAAAAGAALAGAGPAAAATPPALYAAAAAAGGGDCSAAANACTLTAALGKVAPGQTIELVTPGGTAHYAGNWAIKTTGTTATAPVTIKPAPGLASPPVLDGNKGASAGCTTTSCNGPVLTVGQGEYAALSGITIADGDNTKSFGGGLDNAGTVTITGSTFTGNTATNDGGAIDTGDGFSGGTGSVTVTASTFTGNTASGDGGAINSGFAGGGGSVQVTASTFTGNTAAAGGAISSGDSGAGTVTVTASTFVGNTAADGGAIDSGDGGAGSVTVTASTFAGNTATYDGGAIDSGDFGKPGGTVTVTASTFAGNTAADGGAIDSGDNGGGGTVQVAGDLFDGSCARPGGTWTDGGYSAGTDTTCFASTPQTGDKSDPAVGSDLQAALTGNGGPTQTIEPTTGNPAIGLITDPATVTLGGSQVTLCPAVDQRGYASAAGAKCDAGAVQTTGRPAAAVTGLTVTPGYTSLTATWKPSSGATSYQVTVTQHNGSVIKGQATVTGTSARIGGLTPKTTYAVKVLAQPAAPGQKSTVVYATTK